MASRQELRQEIELIDETLILLYQEIWRTKNNGGDEVEPLEDDIRASLIDLSKSSLVKEALVACREFRNSWAHYDYNRIDFMQVGSAIEVLFGWLLSLNSSYKNAHLYLTVRLAKRICYIYGDQYCPTEKNIEKVEAVRDVKKHDKEVGEPAHNHKLIPIDSKHMDEEKDTNRSDVPRRSNRVNLRSLKGWTLERLKKFHEEEMVGARILLLDGKKVKGQKGTFIRWTERAGLIELDGKTTVKQGFALSMRVDIL